MCKPRLPGSSCAALAHRCASACTRKLHSMVAAADATVSVAEGQILLAACDYPGWVISRVDDAAWGNPDSGCNSTTTYMCACGMDEAWVEYLPLLL